MPGHRRVRAHAAGVRAGVAVADPLEVLRRRERHHPRARRRARRRTPPRRRGAPRSRSAPGTPRRPEAPSSSSLGRLADEHALPGREAVDLDDARRHARPPAPRRSARRRRPCTSLAKLFEPSIRAAARPGPNTATPFRRSSSATPATSGASGPITARSTSRLRASAEQASPSSARTGWQSPSRAIPGLPGAACSAASPGAWASFQASACSRPPDPTRSTFTAAESTPVAAWEPSAA